MSNKTFSLRVIFWFLRTRSISDWKRPTSGLWPMLPQLVLQRRFRAAGWLRQTNKSAHERRRKTWSDRNSTVMGLVLPSQTRCELCRKYFYLTPLKNLRLKISVYFKNSKRVIFVQWTQLFLLIGCRLSGWDDRDVSADLQHRSQPLQRSLCLSGQHDWCNRAAPDYWSKRLENPISPLTYFWSQVVCIKYELYLWLLLWVIFWCNFVS